MTIVDVKFRLQGKLIPADNGYWIYSSISKILPELHGNKEIGIHPILGKLCGDRKILITDKSYLTIRLPSERVRTILPLAGKVLKIGTEEIRVGVPNIHALIPAVKLYSRLVVIKGFMEAEPFLDAVKRQLNKLGIKGKPYLVNQEEKVKVNEGKKTGTHSKYLKRTIRIHDKEVVGFAVRVEELTAEESIRLQEKGIGGRRRFGCGIFIPDRR